MNKLLATLIGAMLATAAVAQTPVTTTTTATPAVVKAEAKAEKSVAKAENKEMKEAAWNTKPPPAMTSHQPPLDQ